MTLDLTDRYYPDVYAVDPRGCGCTECIIGEYVPENQWHLNAKSGDVIALAFGLIRDNTDWGDTYLLNAYHYADSSAKEACDAIDQLRNR